MQGLIQKSGYIKPGGGGTGHYAKYIATRDGVETVEDSGTVTEKQQQLIADLLRDFPESRETKEYADYESRPTVSSASAFITAALDDHAHEFRQGDRYMKYIAQRPRSHGLFSAEPVTDLERTMEDVRNHPAPVWTFICSLKRDDAARLGYDSAESWRRLLAAHQVELAEALKIPPKDFRWCAAFHDEKHHPHVHMMVWSADPKQGYLTEKGIEKMRSKLTNEIFQDDLLHLYQQKDLSYKEVTQAAQDAMRELVQEMESSLCASPVIEQKMAALSEMLADTKGKKVYGYLKKPTKKLVDEIVDELATLPRVAECYEVWNRLRDEVENYYKDTPREWLPLSQPKEFKAIKNMVIREAENIRLGTVTFEDEDMADETWEEEGDAPSFQSLWQMAVTYQEAKEVLYDEDVSWAEMENAIQTLEQLWDAGFTVAAHQLGKCWRDGLGVMPDDEKAEAWFRKSAEAGNDFSQYVLGKLLQSGRRIKEAVKWYERASAQRNQYADYRLGKLYLQGEKVPKDVPKAIGYLTASAESGNQYAQYALGKLYLIGQEVAQDREVAWYWFTQSADQGNQYAQFFLDHFQQIGRPSVFLAATKLLHHLAQTFRQNTVPPKAPVGLEPVDRKLRAKIREKKIAMGHKPDDHEERQSQQMGWGGMSM